MNWNKWLHGLLGAVISSTVTTVGAVAGTTMSGTPVDGKTLGGAVLGGAVSGAVLYLRKSPIPEDTNETNCTPPKQE